MRAIPLARIGAVVALGAALLGRSAQAQQSDVWDYRAPGMSRHALEEVLARYEAAAESPAYSEGLRAWARADADAIRARLLGGDLRVGHRMVLTVEGQPQLSDTFVVASGPGLVLPGIGSVPLSGVLRSELETHLADRVHQVYRGAVVRARILTRVAVTGAVARPGFYALSDEALVEDAISAAGGPSGDAVLVEMYLERGRARVVPPDSLQSAMGEARTLADIGVENGDRLVVPRRGLRDVERMMRAVGLAVTLPFSIIALARLF
jgi:protein involved in polysaccharide export with SLBB domain